MTSLKSMALMLVVAVFASPACTLYKSSDRDDFNQNAAGRVQGTPIGFLGCQSVAPCTSESVDFEHWQHNELDQKIQTCVMGKTCSFEINGSLSDWPQEVLRTELLRLTQGE